MVTPDAALNVMVGQRLSALRGTKTQQEVADLIGCTQRAVGLWEKGERGIRASYIVRYACVFGVSTDSILLGDA